MYKGVDLTNLHRFFSGEEMNQLGSNGQRIMYTLREDTPAPEGGTEGDQNVAAGGTQAARRENTAGDATVQGTGEANGTAGRGGGAHGNMFGCRRRHHR